MWIPRWLGEAYSRLWVEYGRRPFTLSELKEVLGLADARARVLVHHLHRRGLLLIFDVGRPRLYRVLTPGSFILLASGRLRRVELRQEAYIQLLYDCFRAIDRALELTSLTLYGSVARGEASKTSDLDLLIISDDLKGSIGERMEQLLREIREETEEELRLLREFGYYTTISPYPLRRDEAKRLPPLFLDMLEDAIILYDEESFFQRLMGRLRERLQRMGARRLRSGKGWYWDLKPDYRPLEAVEI